MKRIIKLGDVNVDGCGTSVETLIQIEGMRSLTDSVIQGIKDAIDEYKSENSGEWDTDSVIDIVCKHLEKEGYTSDYISPDAVIEF